MRLPINEVFPTLQGEGSFTGTPSLFIRLQYCDVGCPWCDTKHTWERAAKNEIGFGTMLSKAKDAPTYAMVEPEQLVRYALEGQPGHVVLTGGEPCAYDLRELTTRLIMAGKSVQIETSGTYDVQAADRAFVTVSPKVNMPGGRVVLASAWNRANEIKMPVGKQADVDRLRDLLTCMPRRLDALVYLQPLSQSEKATALCIKAATDNGWRVSMQTHKYLGIR